MRSRKRRGWRWILISNHARRCKVPHQFEGATPRRVRWPWSYNLLATIDPYIQSVTYRPLGNQAVFADYVDPIEQKKSKDVARQDLVSSSRSTKT